MRINVLMTTLSPPVACNHETQQIVDNPPSPAGADEDDTMEEEIHGTIVYLPTFFG